FFQAEDGIRDFHVTGVQTCAPPILRIFPRNADYAMFSFTFMASRLLLLLHAIAKKYEDGTSDGTLQKLLWDCQMTIGDFQSRERSEERRVGKEWRQRW